MDQLPDELLALIFATGLHDLSSDAHQPLLALICSVCRHWRDVAIEASELWTHYPRSLGGPSSSDPDIPREVKGPPHRP